MSAQKLRDYQESAVHRVFDAWRAGARSVLLVLPTGGGKTTVFASIAHNIPARALVCVHRRELATQAADRFTEFGTDFGFVMAGMPAKPYARVQIASVPTLVRRERVPDAALVIPDEAHLSTAKTWQTVLERYPRAKVLGATATPWRLSGKPLASAYDAVVIAATPNELRERGFLCDYSGFSYRTPDLSSVHTVGGEYNERESARAMRDSLIVDNVVEEWLKHASHLSTVVFCVTVEHSKEVTEKFKAAGVRAEHLDGSMGLELRKSILRRVANGETQVLCNVGVAVEGLDIPRLKCCVLARPTKSLARAIQMMGRVRRPWNGQTARIHDHAFVIKQHGLPDSDRDYSLSAKPEAPPSLTQCEACFALYEGPKCPACDHENARVVRGETELARIADAEQFQFSSGGEEAPAPEPRPEDLPMVEVRWDRPDRKIEGVLLGHSDRPAPWGTQRIYRVRGKRRVYLLPGSAHLDLLMKRAPTGRAVRITFRGEADIGRGRTKKLFTLAVDDGT